MELIKTASGVKKIKMSKQDWIAMGKKAGWIKEAKTYEVSYSVGFSPEIKRVRVRVEPSKMPAGMTEEEWVERKLTRDEGKNIVVEKMIPSGAISKKKGPNQKDLQRQRGEKMRRERQRRKDEEAKNQWRKNRLEELGLPADLDPQIADALIEQEEQQGADVGVGLADLLRSRQIAESLKNKKKG
jgi:hypothetical protein